MSKTKTLNYLFVFASEFLSNEKWDLKFITGERPWILSWMSLIFGAFTSNWNRRRIILIDVVPKAPTKWLNTSIKVPLGQFTKLYPCISFVYGFISRMSYQPTHCEIITLSVDSNKSGFLPPTSVDSSLVSF